MKIDEMKVDTIEELLKENATDDEGCNHFYLLPIFRKSYGLRR